MRPSWQTSPEVGGLIDQANSSATPLAAFGVFTGAFSDVSGVVSISISVNSDQPSNLDGIEVQWSTDGVSIDQRQLFTFNGPFFIGFGNSSGNTFHSCVRAQFYRIVYTNNFTAQTMFHLQVMLRKGTASGTTVPVGTKQVFFTQTLDAQVGLGIMAAQDFYNDQFVVPLATTLTNGLQIGQSYLMVAPTVAQTFLQRQTTPASLTAIELDNVPGTNARTWGTIYNNTIRGNLFISLGVNPTTTAFDYKVPPRHTWCLPRAWVITAAPINGIWDIADGSATFVQDIQGS